MAQDDNEQRDRILQALRVHGMAFREIGRDFGVRMGLHATDATALVEILEAQDRGTPLTQSGLSRRIGLTPGATSSLLNRLEEAGHVTRARDHADRRIVTLRAAPGVEAGIGRYFGPLVDRADALMRHYPPEVLAGIEQFLTEYGAMLTDHLDRRT